MPLPSSSAAASRSSITQSLIALAVVMVGAGFYACFQFVIPGYVLTRDEYATIEQELARSQQAANALNAARQQVVSATTTLQQSGVDVAVVDEMLPQTEDIPGLYQLLDGVVRENSSLDEVTYQIGQAVRGTDGKVEVKLVVAAQGSYADCKKLIASMQEMLRPVTFTSISITSSVSDSTLYSISAEGFVRARALTSEINEQ